MKKKIYILFVLGLLISCTKQKSMEDVFYTDSNEYWQYYYSGKYYGPIYLKFNKNNTIDHVSINKDKFINTNSGQNIETGSIKWSVSKDTILTWDAKKFDIVSYNDKIIILYNQGKEEPDGKIVSGFIYLVKGSIGDERRDPGYFGYKRELYPEKYREH